MSTTSITKRKLTNPLTCNLQQTSSNSLQTSQKRLQIKAKTRRIIINEKKDSDDEDDDFDYEQYRKEKIKQEQLFSAILEDVKKELQKTGKLDERIGLTDSEIDLIQTIAEQHKLNTLK